MSNEENEKIGEKTKESPSQAVSQQLRPKSKLLWYVLGVLVFLILSVFSNYLWHYIGSGQWHKFVGVPYDTVGKPIGKTDPTVGWKTYENKDYGFSFKYPGETQFSVEQITRTDSDVALIRLSDDVLDPIIKFRKVDCDQQKNIIFDNSISLNGKFDEHNNTGIINIKLPNEKCIKITKFIYLPRENLLEDNNLIDQILSTFRFTK